MKAFLFGRIGRLTYFGWMFLLAVMFVSLRLDVLNAIAPYVPFGYLDAVIWSPILMLVLIAGRTVLVIRRLHDLGRSGWLSLVSLVPIVNWVLGIYLLFTKGQAGSNKYGSQPLSGRASGEVNAFGRHAI